MLWYCCHIRQHKEREEKSKKMILNLLYKILKTKIPKNIILNLVYTLLKYSESKQKINSINIPTSNNSPITIYSIVSSIQSFRCPFSVLIILLDREEKTTQYYINGTEESHLLKCQWRPPTVTWHIHITSLRQHNPPQSQAIPCQFTNYLLSPGAQKHYGYMRPTSKEEET